MTPEIDSLVRQLQAADHAYYNPEETPLLTDEQYDRLLGELKALAPDHPYLQQLPGSTAQENPYQEIFARLTKLKSVRPIFEYEDAKATGLAENYEMLAMTKGDGQAWEALYIYGVFTFAISRGRQGNNGRNITGQLGAKLPPKVAAWSHIPELVVTGEGLILNDDYERLKAKYPALSNQRNSLSLIMKEKYDPADLEFFTPLAYNLNYVGAPGKKSERLIELKTHGFAIIDAWISEEPYEEVFTYHKSDFNYLTDGIVICVDDVAAFDELGGDTKYDEGQLALKYGNWASDYYWGEVEAVVWSIGRKKFTPVAQIKPVFTPSGKKVTNVNIYNVAQILKHQILPGTKIYFVYQSEINPGMICSEHTYYEGIAEETDLSALLAEETGSTIYDETDEIIYDEEEFELT